MGSAFFLIKDTHQNKISGLAFILRLQAWELVFAKIAPNGFADRNFSDPKQISVIYNLFRFGLINIKRLLKNENMKSKSNPVLLGQRERVNEHQIVPMNNRLSP